MMDRMDGENTQKQLESACPSGVDVAAAEFAELSEAEAPEPA